MFALAAAVAERRHLSKQSAACATAGFLLGAPLGAAILLPGAHHAGKTDRAPGLAVAEAGNWSMPPARVLDFLTPHALGHVIPGQESSYRCGTLYGDRKSPYLYSLYPGLLATLLALLAWRRRWHALLPWLVLAGFGFLLALGRHTPLWRQLFRLPLLHAIRYPEKFALLCVLPVLVAAAVGFDLFLLGSARARRGLAPWLTVLAGVGLAVALAVGLACSRLSGNFPIRQTVGDGFRIAGVAATALLLVLPRWGLGRRSLGLPACR
jgi:hypothetical protein